MNLNTSYNVENLVLSVRDHYWKYNLVELINFEAFFTSSVNRFTGKKDLQDILGRHVSTWLVILVLNLSHRDIEVNLNEIMSYNRKLERHFRFTYLCHQWLIFSDFHRTFQLFWDSLEIKSPSNSITFQFLEGGIFVPEQGILPNLNQNLSHSK